MTRISRTPVTTIEPAGHRFAVTDATILAAALAIGLSLDTTPLASARRMAAEHWAFHRGSPITDKVDWAVTLASPPLAALSLALFGLQFRRRRTSRARLSLRPGVVALVAASVAIALHSLGRIPRLYLVWGAIDQFDHLYDFWRPLRLQAGTAVAAAWATLTLAGRWAPEPTWIDRAGRGVGVAWLIGLGASIGVVYRVFYLKG